MSGTMGRSVSIIGVGCTPIGITAEHEPIKNLTEGELLAAAVIDAVEDAGIDLKQIDYYVTGILGPNYNSNMTNVSAMLSKYIGMKHMPGISHDEACCSGSYGLQVAVSMVASGIHDVVLNCGTGIGKTMVPLNKPHLPQFYQENTFAPNPAHWINEANYANPGDGMMDPFDQAGVLYAKKNGLSKANMREIQNCVMVNARENALKNPVNLMVTETWEQEAQRMGCASMADYINNDMFNPRLGTLLRVKDMNQIIDGAAAMIVCPTEMAEKICKHPVEVAGFGGASAWPQDMAGIPFEADVLAAKRAYAMAGITDPGHELDMLTIHDCTTLNWLRFTEDVGYFEPGEAYKAILNGDIKIGGAKPINTSGGRQGLGHPLAGANIYDMMEVVLQMRGEAGERQVPNAPKVAGVQSYAGGHSYTMTVLRAL